MATGMLALTEIVIACTYITLSHNYLFSAPPYSQLINMQFVYARARA